MLNNANAQGKSTVDDDGLGSSFQCNNVPTDKKSPIKPSNLRIIQQDDDAQSNETIDLGDVNLEFLFDSEPATPK